MKAAQTFTVVSQLPEALEPLREVALNLGWSNDERALDLFRRLDGRGPESRDPALVLATETSERLEELAADAAFTSLASTVRDELRKTLDEPRWFQHREASPLKSVAYFSPEFGIAAALPQYSGGLGVLAGDHLKAANDLGLPLTGVGLFYRHGYFRQELDRRGWQMERFPRLDPRAMALEPVEDVMITVDLAGIAAHARLWKATVGRTALYLLDTDIDENDEKTRLTCDRLYGGGPEERIRQEIMLGIGGIRALDALGLTAQVFHMNEGHAGFLGLERIRHLMLDHGLTFDEARTANAPATIFTTHTPVPAGIDRFPRDLMDRYFSNWCHELGLSMDHLMALGHEPGTPEGEVFNLAALSLRLAERSNGVSKLHGAVSRKLFADLWPGIPETDTPITSVTNGVHARTWTFTEMTALLDRTIGQDWPEADEERWRRVEEIGDRDMWKIMQSSRESLVTFARQKIRSAALRRGMGEAQTAWADQVLDPNVLTIGFARRFATYKRATLLFGDVPRLKALLLDQERPIQIVFAGKAHPADEAGHHLLQTVANLASDPEIRHRLVLLEDYDISVAQILVSGVDVWLNNPLRPNEACGTSGMKAVFNGVLNCSVLDGWWDEMYEPDVGWAIPSIEDESDIDARNAFEAASVFSLLERQIIPLFYKRDHDGLPDGWLTKVKRSIARLGPRVTATRMLCEYVEDLYEPAAMHSDEMRADEFGRSRQFVSWKNRIESSWHSVGVSDISHESSVAPGSTTHSFEARVSLGDIDPSDVEVQIALGEVDLDDNLRDPRIETMLRTGEVDSAGFHLYQRDITFDRAGNFGFTVRVIPSHADLTNFAQLGLVAWPTAGVDEYSG